MNVSLVTAFAAGAFTACSLTLLWLQSNKKSEEKNWTAEQLIAHRRSIFPIDYDQSKPVSKSIIQSMLRAADWAPTHKRTEPWRFVVFYSAEARKRLGEFQAELYKNMVPADKFLKKKHQAILEASQKASAIITIGMHRQESEQLPEWEEIASVAMAVENMHIVASAHNVGAYWTSGGPTVSNEMKEFLGLQGKDRCIGMMYVGNVRDDFQWPKGERKPLTNKIQWME